LTHDSDDKGKKCPSPKATALIPLDVIAKYGTDCFALALLIGNTPEIMRACRWKSGSTKKFRQ